jgi:hypothetical protein
MQILFANVPTLVVLLKVKTITIDNIEVIICMKYKYIYIDKKN